MTSRVFAESSSVERRKPNRRVSGRMAYVVSWVWVGLLAANWGLAAVPEEPTWGYSLAHEVMSPFCPGRTLSACTSPQAAELRQWILLQESAGASREEVVAILEERYGDAVRSMPEADGWGLAAWLLPAAVAAIGALVVALVLRRMVAKPQTLQDEPDRRPLPETPSLPADEELQRRVDRELSAHER